MERGREMKAGQGSEVPVMMQLGDSQFGLESAAYQALERSTHWRWADLKQPRGGPALQYGGQDSDRITLPGVIYPEWRGSAGQMDRLRALADRGEALLMVDGRGNVLGDWVIERLDERQSVFAGRGVPRRIDFSLVVRRVERRAGMDAGFGGSTGLEQLGVGKMMAHGGVHGDGMQAVLKGGLVVTGVNPGDPDRLGSVEDPWRDERIRRQKEKYRKLRRDWRDFRQKTVERYQQWDKRFRADVKLYMNGVDDLVRRVTQGAPGSKEMLSVAGALRRAGETSGKLLRYAGQVNRILDNRLLSGVARRHGEKIARLNRVTGRLAKVRMQAESAAAVIERHAERVGKASGDSSRMPGSEYLDLLVEARVLSQASVEKCRRFHERLVALTRNVTEDELKEAEARAAEAEPRARQRQSNA